MRAMIVFFGLRRHINYARYGSLAIINCWPMVGFTRWMESRFSGDTRMIDDPLYLYFVMAESKANAQQQHLHLVPNVRAIIRKHKQKTEKSCVRSDVINVNRTWCEMGQNSNGKTIHIIWLSCRFFVWCIVCLSVWGFCGC